MDIVTHAMAGTTLAGPFLPVAPLTAGCFILGSVLPDVDALSRLFGKMAFLRCHQTYTHSLPLIILATALLWPVGRWFACDEPWVFPALGAGMALHVLMDATNTYGVALSAPFRRRRYCTEWLFFIDGITATVSAVGMGVVLFQLHDKQAASPATAVLYGGFLVGYWIFRGLCYRRARRLAPPGTRSLIPSALIPWRFFGLAVREDVAELFDFNLIRGTSQRIAACRTFDSQFAELLRGILEYAFMRELSRGYHVVEAVQRDGKTQLVCRDLRIRNFGGHFGQLDLTFNAGGRLEKKVFHV